MTQTARVREQVQVLLKPVAEWTPAEALAHLRFTFEQACIAHSELMESYIVMRVDAAGDPAQEMEVMRQALRDTVKKRYPFTMGVAEA